MSYYIISLKHSKPKDLYLTLWRPDNAGYCYSKQMAGCYETPEEGYHNSESSMPITVEQAEKLFIKADWDGEERDMIPNSPAIWAILGVKIDRRMYGLKRTGKALKKLLGIAYK
jgi:hypothetical protein